MDHICRFQTSLAAEACIARTADIGIGLEIDALDLKTSSDQVFIRHDYDIPIPRLASARTSES